jgi:hypothetical protein|tara:strand:- start:412 stop:702 length:291 start_codon:yes stop_codon:yes gene_type:complete
MSVIKLLNYKPEFDYQLMVEVDVDPLAERCVIMSRDKLEILGVTSQVSASTRFRLPMQYASTDNIMVLILDKTREYNAAILDGVTAEIIDANLVKI